MDRLSAIFDEVQQSTSAGSKALSQKLRKTLQSAESEDVRQTMLTAIWRGCMDQCLLCPKKDRAVEKMVLFLTQFISSSVAGSGEGDDYVLASGIDHLLQRSRAVDKAVRLRACQLIAGIMLKVQGSEVAEEVLVKMIDVLTPRLRDKAPNVRVWAVKVFEWLQIEDDFITEEMARLLNEDSSKEVRVAAVESICMSKTVLPLIIARVKDTKPEVRIAAMKRLSDPSIHAKCIDSASVALIVRFGLNDRDASVKLACKGLVLKWLADYGNNVPKFLRFMDFEVNEEEVETVCHAVMEIVEKGECGVSHDLSVSVRQDGPNWEETAVAKLNPSEILWAFNRCDYAHKHMSQVAAAAFVEALVPDMVTLGAMLQDARKPALYSSAKYQMNVRYLIRLTGFLDASDVCGCKGLVQVFEEMLSDTNLPEMLVEPMLASWQLASGFGGSTAAIHAAVALAQQVVAQTSAAPTPRSSLGGETDIALPGDSDDEDEGEEGRERHRTLASIRSLQVVSWSLQQHIGNRDSVLGFGQYDALAPFIVECLSQPCPDLRGLSVRCLGLLSLASQEKCQEFHQIILQVARNEIEEAETRCAALEALVDMATVYAERFQDDSALTQFLLRLQIDGAEPALLRVGAESAAKLLFSGRLSEPKLFANLIKFFFLPELAGAGDENRPVEEAYLGSTARLQQILSVFFQAFFVAGNGREDIAFGCTSDLVADLAMLIRDEEIDPSAMGRMAQNLLALCENIKNPLSATSVSVLAPVPAPVPAPVAEAGADAESDAPPAAAVAAVAAPASQDYAETARNVFRMRLTAALCREILKMGGSRVETAAIKEFIKVMGNLSPQSWMRTDLAPTLLTVFDTIAQCCPLDKAVRKVFVERVVAACEEVCPAVIDEEEGGRFQFFNLAPGLGDMLLLTAKDLDPDQTKDLRESCKQYLRESAPSSSQTTKKPAAKRATSKRSKKDVEDEEDEDEEEDEENDAPIVPKGKTTSTTSTTSATNAASSKAAMPPPAPLATSNRPARSSKSAAASKIASQLSDHDAQPIDTL